MRRFSQRSALVTLSEINITPLLDLAFVLLIIFIITTPMLTGSIQLKMPEGGVPDQQILQEDIRTIEINPDGRYFFNGKETLLDDIERSIVQDYANNPNLVIYIRADEEGRNKDLYAVIDRCQQNGITRYSLRTRTPVKTTPKR